MAKKPLDFTSFSSDEIINGCRQFENLYDANIEAPGEYLERKRSRDMQTLIRHIVDNELEGIRKIIFMRVFFEEEKIQDVASSLEICQSNAYKHYEKALKKMRESLKYVVVYLNCCRNDEMTPLESMQKYAFASRKNTSLPDDALIRISENKVYIYSTRDSAEYTSFDVDSSADSAEGMEGTNLGIGNYIIHSSMGSVNYSCSDIRQWLNSDKTDWWQPVDSNSLAPLDYLNIPGFENGIDEDFLMAVNPVVKEATLPDGSKVTCEDRFFLLSLEEVYGCEGKSYSYYSEGTSLSAPGLTADALRVRNFEGNPRYWWLRDSAPSDDGLMRVTPTGAIGPVKNSRVLAYGIAPACCIC